MIRIVTMIALLASSLVAAPARAGDWQGVEEALGRSGVVQGDLLKVTFPRSDLTVRVGDVTVEPGLALTSWAGFKGMGHRAMMMGDLVLLEREVAPVMARLRDAGVEITALHNHLLNERPVVMYLHFSASGEPPKLAEALRAALSLTGTPLTAQPQAPAASPPDWTTTEAILGKSGQKKGPLIQFGFPRRERIVENGMEIPPFLGMATGITMQKVGGRAATTGDFVLLADEVNPVVRALTSHGIAVTAVHSHMLAESPRLFFLHFWGVDTPEQLARGLKAALSRTNSVP
jgi:hypothetical protein